MVAANLPGYRAENIYRLVSANFAIASSVSVVIPVRNEARNLPKVFETIPNWISEVVLVDGRSADDTVAVARGLWPRSEEHTSELQSLRHLVCRLLLEKKEN